MHLFIRLLIGKKTSQRATASTSNGAFFIMVALSQQDKTTKITPPAKTNGGHCEIGLALILKKISSFSKKYFKVELRLAVKGKNFYF